MKNMVVLYCQGATIFLYLFVTSQNSFFEVAGRSSFLM